MARFLSQLCGIVEQLLLVCSLYPALRVLFVHEGYKTEPMGQMNSVLCAWTAKLAQRSPILPSFYVVVALLTAASRVSFAQQCRDRMDGTGPKGRLP